MVASFSPHRHHGETATLFSGSHQESPSSPHHLLHSPTSFPSPFTLALPASAKTRSSTRRLTPLKSRALITTAPASPVKFPLSLSSYSNMNSGGMTLRSGSSSPRSPREKLALQRQNRTGIGVENGGTHRASSGSPLKRSDGIRDLNQASRGSPIAKRRPQFGSYPSSSSSRQPTFDSSWIDTPTSTRRGASVKKSSNNSAGEKASYLRNRPQARQQLEPSDPMARVRRTTSIDNFMLPLSRESPFAAHIGPLPSASAHPHNGSESVQNSIFHVHPLSKLHSSVPYQPSGQFGVDSRNQGYPEVVTPQNYKLAKPNPAAFHSTGFVPKRGRMNVDKDMPQPDTPCKRHSVFSVLQPKITAGHAGVGFSVDEFAGSATPFGAGGGAGKLSLGGFARRDSNISNEDGEDASEFGGQSQSSSEYELPPTPTKKVYTGSNGIFPRTKRVRSENSAEGLRVRMNGHSPHTPKDSLQPPDPSSLSISGRAYHPSATRGSKLDYGKTVPATPARDYFPPFEFLNPSSAPHLRTVPSFDGRSIHVTHNFASRFSEVRHIGSGEFSEVYQVTEGGAKRSVFASSLTTPITPHQLATPGCSSTPPWPSSPIPNNEPPLRIYAVKRAKSPYHGLKDRSRQMEEVRILKALGKHEHVVEYVDNWEEEQHIYIQTEFCENGSLDKFLEQHGNKGRLDEFRVWKVILELCSGLKHIHDAGFIHLDLKPANVLITFDGALKISDFGMATQWPASTELEREGDREYIAPEVIQEHRYDKPVDIFALGLTIIEIAGNETLPPNGPLWQSLRSGDISVAPTLSTSSSGEFVHRDDEGNPLATELVDKNSDAGFLSAQDPESPTVSRRAKLGEDNRLSVSPRRRGSLLHKPRPGDLVHPPSFMADRGLEKIVQLMITAEPAARPTVTELLDMEELQWVDSRRRCPATIFEGLWGPSDVTICPNVEDDLMMGCNQLPKDGASYSSDDWSMIM